MGNCTNNVSDDYTNVIILREEMRIQITINSFFHHTRTPSELKTQESLSNMKIIAILKRTDDLKKIVERDIANQRRRELKIIVKNENNIIIHKYM